MILEIFIWVTAFFLIIFFGGALFGATWIPTKKKEFERIARLVQLNPGMIFYDLGSGDAKLLFYLAQKYNVICVGIEISPILYLYSKFKSLFSNNVRIKYGNFLKYDLSNADVIYAFLLPSFYPKLERKIRDNINKESTLILLSTWPFENKKQFKIDEKKGETVYYLYKKADL